MKILILCFLSACSSVPVLSDRMEDTCSFKALETYETENQRSSNPSDEAQELADKAIDSIMPKVQQCYKSYLKESGDQRVIPTCFVAKIDSKHKRVFYDFSSRQAQLPKSLTQCLNSTRNDDVWDKVGPITFYQNFYLRP